MPPAQLIQLISFLVIFLFPVAIYLTILGGVNRHPHPVFVAGPWDGVGLLFASSGFLLVAGPAILFSVYQRGILVLLLSQVERNPVLDFVSRWEFVWGTYYGLVVLGSVLFLLSRRQRYLVYNIEPALFEGVLLQALGNLHVVWARKGHRLFLWRPHSVAMVVQATPEKKSQPSSLDEGIIATVPVVPASAKSELDLGSLAEADSQLTLRIDPFPSLFNLTLTWSGPAQDVWEELEAELRKLLPTVYTRDNPIAGWLFTLSAGMFGILAVGVLLFLIYAFLMPRP